MKLTLLVALNYMYISHGKVNKHIPDEVAQHYQFIDPKIQHVPSHNITLE